MINAINAKSKQEWKLGKVEVAMLVSVKRHVQSTNYGIDSTNI